MSNVYIKTGQRYLTKGGWKAVVCDDEFCTVYHEVNGGCLYSHTVTGQIRSNSVADNFSLQYLLVPLESEF